MTLPRETAVPATIDEYAAFAELVSGLSAEEWEQPTRCEGWRVADVAAHVIGQLTDTVNFRLDGLGSPEVTQRQVDERRGRTPAQLADELTQTGKVASDLLAAFDDAAWNGPAPGGTPGTLGFGVEALWYDAYLHADDIRAAIGRPSERGPGLTAAVSHVTDSLTEQGFAPATVKLDGVPEFAISGGGGRTIEGDALAFVLAATGRGDLTAFGLDDTANLYRA